MIRRVPLRPKVDDLFRQLDRVLVDMKELDEFVTIGIVVSGPAKEYALVWEWGNVRQTKKGPKTTRGINPDGKEVWLTIQAPFGYIRVNTPRYWQIVEEEMNKVDFFATGSKVDKSLFRASERIAERILEVIKDTVPVDTEQLKDALRAFVEISMTE